MQKHTPTRALRQAARHDGMVSRPTRKDERSGRRRRAILALAALPAVLPLWQATARAEVKNYTGAADASWDTAGNWAPNPGEPTAADDAIFPGAIPGTGGTVTLITGEVANSLTFRNAYTLTGGDLALTGPGNVTVAPTFTATIASILAGGGGVTLAAGNGLTGDDLQAGGGILVLSGANTYTGNTTINSGILSITTAGNLGAAAGAIILDGGTLQSTQTANLALPVTRTVTVNAGGGTIRNNPNFELRINGLVSGPGALTLITAGTQSLVLENGTNNQTATNPNTYSGGTTIAPGGTGAVIPIQSSAGAPNAPTNGPFGTGTIDFAGGNFRATGNGPVTLHNRITLSANTTIPGGGATLTFLGDTALAGGTRTITQNGNNPVVFSGPVSDGGNQFGITKAGAGVLTLAGANTYTGATTINSGAVVFGTPASAQSTNAITMATQAGTTAAPILGVRAGGAGEFTTATSGPGSIGGALAGMVGPGVTFTPNSSFGIDTTNAPAAGVTYDGVIDDASGGTVVRGLAKIGTGTLTLTADNTYTGETLFFAGGVLNVPRLTDYGVPGPLGARTAAQEISGNDTGIGLHFKGGNLRFTGSSPTSTNRQIRVSTAGGTIEASGTTPDATLSFTHSGANTNLFDGAGARTITLAGTNTGANSFGILIANQAANGATSLTKSGTGTWVLPRENTYTGTTVVNAGGVLRITNNTALGGTGAIATNGPHTNIVGNNGGTGRLELAGDITIGESIQIEARQNASLNVPALSNFSGTNTVTAQITGVTGGSTYNIESQSGTLILAGGFTLGATATGTNRVLQLMGSGSGIVSGVLSNGGGTLQVNKFGAGTWSLTGAATNSGTWTVSEGSLLANNATGSATGTGPVNVGGAGILGGTGSIAGPVTVNLGGTINPGTSPGTLSVGGPVTSGTTGAGALPTFLTELVAAVSPTPGTHNDVLALTGTGAAGVLDLTNPDQLNLVALTPITDQATYTIATFASTTGAFDTVLVNGQPSQSGDPAGANYALVTYNPTNIQVTVDNLAAVPEPASVGLLGLGALGLLARRRRRGA